MSSSSQTSPILEINDDQKIDQDVLKSILQHVQDNMTLGDVKWDYDSLPKDKESLELIEKIESQLMKNNDEFNRFPNDYMHGLMAYDVYREHVKEGEIINLENEEWTALRVVEEPNEDNKITKVKKGSFYTAVLYCNHKKRQLVVAHKGVDVDFASLFRINGLIKNKMKDVMLNDIVPQLSYCYEFVQEANLIAKEKNYYLSFSGYSHGAWLAEHAINLSKTYFNNINTRAVLFEGPGIIKNKNETELKSSNIIDDHLNIVNYLSSPNFSNSINRHAGKVYRLFIDDLDASNDNDLADFLDKIKKIPKFGDIIYEKVSKNKFILQGLYLIFFPKNLRKLLERFDKKSGQPVEYEHVDDWPIFKSAFNESFLYVIKNMASNPNENIASLFPDPNIVDKFSSSILRAILSILRENLTHMVMPGTHFIVNLTIDMINNNIQISEFENEFFHKKLSETNISLRDTHNSKKRLKNYEINSDLTLFYKGVYKTRTTDDFNQILEINNETKNLDWCLFYLKSCNLKENMPSKLIHKQLLSLRSNYKFEKNTNDRTIKIISTNHDFSINLLKERLNRLIDVQPSIKHLIQPHLKSYEDFSTNSFINKLPKKLDKYTRKAPLFERINQQFFDHKKRSIMVYGPHGSGKTQLAVEYGNYIKNHMVRYFVMNSSENIESNYIENLFYQLELNFELMKKNEIDVKLEAIKHKLKLINSNILFVFDDVNYDVLNLVHLIFNQLPLNVKIIVLTNNGPDDANRFEYQLEIEMFDRKEAENYLINNKILNNKKINQDDSDYILNSLKIYDQTYPPLTLNNILTFLKQSEHKETTIKMLIDKVKPNNYEKLDEYIIRELYMDTMDMVELLTNLAFFEPNYISQDLLIKLTLYDKNTIKPVLAKLKDLSIFKELEVTTDDGAVFLYSLDYQFLKDLNTYVLKYIEDREIEELYKKNVKIFLDYLENCKANLSSHYSNNPKMKTLLKIDLNHIESFLNNFDTDKINKQPTDLTNEALCHGLISYINKEVFFKYNKSLKHEMTTLKIFGKVYGDKDDENVADALNSVGFTYMYMVDFSISIQYQNKALEMYKRIFGNNLDQIRVGDSYYSLGCNHRNLNNNEIALKHFETAIEIYRKTLNNEEHPSIVNTLNNLGQTYSNLGQYKKALEYLKDSLEKKNKIYDNKNDSSIAELYSDMGIVYSCLKQYEKSIECQMEALIIFNQIYNNQDHARIAELLNNIGSTYMSYGKHEESLNYLNKALDMYVRIYGNDEHISIANVINNIGLSYRDVKNYTKAIEFVSKSLEIKKKLFNNESHLSIAESFGTLGIFFILNF